MNSTITANFISKFWDDSVMPSLCDYIRIPCKSINFDENWEKTGDFATASRLVGDWILKQGIPGTKVEVLEIPKRTPVLFVEIPGNAPGTILFYSHLDKMPESTGWDEGLSPWTPVIKDEKLYGRGGVDDGYAPYSAVAAIKALREQGIPHAKCLFFIEYAEESGSPDFMPYLEKFKDKIGEPNLILVLDNDGADSERLWEITSIRGNFSATLKVSMLSKGAHSGVVSGMVATPFRILRQLLDRIEDQKTGKVLLESAHVEIPEFFKDQAKSVAAIIGDKVMEALPLLDGCKPLTTNASDILIDTTWRPTLCVTGAEGLPHIKDAGNVLLPFIEVKLSMRMPPRVDMKKVVAEMKQKLESDAPYGAKVEFNVTVDPMIGWDSLSAGGASWVEGAFNDASKTYFGKDAAFVGTGGSIGPVAILAEVFPKARMLLTGAGTPDCGAHGPNEFLSIPLVKKVTCCVAHLLAEHSKANN